MIRSRTLKVSSELFEDILQGTAGTWLLLLLSEYNCQLVLRARFEFCGSKDLLVYSC